MTDDVLFERRHALGVITLNRPKALNALTREMCVAVREQLLAWQQDDAIKTIVIRGVGEKAFCAGGDIRALYDAGKQSGGSEVGFFRDEYRMNAAIKHCTKPYVALLHGVVMGGGVGISIHGRHRVLSDNVTFAMPETAIGLFPDVGGSYFLPRLPGEIGMYLALTGERLKMADCLYAGIGTSFVPSRLTEELLTALESGDDPDLVLRSFEEKNGPSLLAENREIIDRTFSEDSVDGILAALDADESEWARATAATLRKRSPASLKVTFHQVRQGARLSFDECLRMEFRIVNRMMKGHDFYEGVRALLIDKDQSPRWNPATLEAVTEADVARYFVPLGAHELTLGEEESE